jgi:lipid A disaccharide synthetase
MTEKTSINNEEAIVKLLDGSRESLKKELDRMSFVAVRSLQDILSGERREYIISQTAEQKEARLANPHECQFSCITNTVMDFTNILP